MIDLSPGLIARYRALFAAAGAPSAAARARAAQIAANMTAYAEVSRRTGVHRAIVGIIHSLEGNLSFRTMLHEGGLLPGPTTKEPKGRGPFASWTDAAVDAIALKTKRAPVPDDPLVEGDPGPWTIEAALFWWERYNGWGYLQHHREVNSPYLWAGTPCYPRGKYASDGKFDPDLVSRQIGAAPLLAALFEIGAVARWRNEPLRAGAGGFYEQLRLQQMLNEFPGELLKVDGNAGPKTRARFKEVYP